MGALIRTANKFKNSDFPTPRGYEQAVHEKSLALARNFSTASHITDQLTKELFFFFSFFVFIALGGCQEVPTRGGPPVLFPFTIYLFSVFIMLSHH